MTANFIVDLVCGGALLSVIIVHNQARVNDSWNPAEQSQDEAEEEAHNATGHEHGEGWQHDTEKISQRFHLLSLPLCLSLRLSPLLS
jgi:hypothetical protein